jgi:NAD(P)-dependent dehydrogenase (short-subunit alcohol dehydrogenase family)
MGRYEGKKAVITGGTTGIGLATARLLVSEGARLVVTGRSAGAIAAARAELGARAGIAKFVPLAEVDERHFDETFDINTKGAYFTAQQLVPLIVDGGGLVFNTSVVDEKGMAATSVYSASKAALRSLARTFAAELLPRKVRVNAVSPGPIPTPILEKGGMAPEAREATARYLQESNPMKRFGLPEEVARAALFLAFEATYTTGAELPVDGGLTQL